MNLRPVLTALMIATVGVEYFGPSVAQAQEAQPRLAVESNRSVETEAATADIGDDEATESTTIGDGPADLPSNAVDFLEPNREASGNDDGTGQSQPSEDVETEVIYERYANGAIKLEREVLQDEYGNYVNDGRWRMWDQQGVTLAEGDFSDGQREGVWTRWHAAAQNQPFSKPPYSMFQAPFVSQATFRRGELDGSWTIVDGKQRKICRREFVGGKRHGSFAWWYPNGNKLREVEYSDGEIHGQLVEWAIDGTIVAKETYIHGRKLATRVERNTAGVKKTEGVYLLAREIERTPDDWWNGQPATYSIEGRNEKHGHWVSWYSDGQQQAEGEYCNGVPTGKFVWWHANGQKITEGAYVDGEQDGKWVWWHENGQKSVQGQYAKGQPLSQWTWWNVDGIVAKSTDMDSSATIVSVPNETPLTQPIRSAAKPNGLNYRPLR